MREKPGGLSQAQKAFTADNVGQKLGPRPGTSGSVIVRAHAGGRPGGVVVLVVRVGFTGRWPGGACAPKDDSPLTDAGRGATGTPIPLGLEAVEGGS